MLTKDKVICLILPMSETIFYNLIEPSGNPPTLSSQVAGEIGRQIVCEDYPAGELIEDESALAERYHVSRSVIRDAVKMLAGKGLLEVRRGIGTRVRSRSNWGLYDDDVMAWSQSAPPNPDRLWKLLELRQVIEPKAARWAAERGLDSAHKDIKIALKAMYDNLSGGEKFVIADAGFHRSILRATENEFLIAMEGVIFSALLSSIRLTNSSPEYSIPSMGAHAAVCEAILARNADSAEDAMYNLLVGACNNLKEKTAAMKN